MKPMLLAGSGNPDLTESLATSLGVPSAARTGRHPDGEVDVHLREEAAGRDVFVVGSLAEPSGERLLELLLLGDAARRAGARRTIALVPYLAYARQERRTRPGQPLGARVVADLLSSRFDRVVALDLHAAAIEGFFAVPFEHLTAVPAIAAELREGLARDPVVVAPDLGASKLAEQYARLLEVPFAVVHKTRRSGRVVTAHGVIGSVSGRSAILVDDMISTGGTMVEAAKALLDAGCRRELTLAATHLLLVDPATERLGGLPVSRIVGTGSLPVPRPEALPLRVLPLGPLLADAARRLAEGRSLDGLYAAR